MAKLGVRLYQAEQAAKKASKLGTLQNEFEAALNAFKKASKPSEKASKKAEALSAARKLHKAGVKVDASDLL